MTELNQETQSEVEAVKEIDPKTKIYIQNLQTVIDLPAQSRDFSALWDSQRDEFFIQVAKWLELNLGSFETSIIYNDLKKPKSEEEKPQLTKTILTKAPVESTDTDAKVELEVETKEWLQSSLSQAHESLFAKYEENLKVTPQLLELSNENYSLGGSIKGSPFLVMGKLSTCNSLQQSLVTSLFKEIEFLTAAAK